VKNKREFVILSETLDKDIPQEETEAWLGVIYVLAKELEFVLDG